MYFCSYTGAAVQGSWLLMVALTHKSIWSVLSWSVTFTLYGLRVCARMRATTGEGNSTQEEYSVHDAEGAYFIL